MEDWRTIIARREAAIVAGTNNARLHNAERIRSLREQEAQRQKEATVRSTKPLIARAEQELPEALRAHKIKEKLEHIRSNIWGAGEIKEFTLSPFTNPWAAVHDYAGNTEDVEFEPPTPMITHGLASWYSLELLPGQGFRRGFETREGNGGKQLGLVEIDKGLHFIAIGVAIESTFVQSQDREKEFASAENATTWLNLSVYPKPLDSYAHLMSPGATGEFDRKIRYRQALQKAGSSLKHAEDVDEELNYLLALDIEFRTKQGYIDAYQATQFMARPPEQVTSGSIFRKLLTGK